LLPPSFGLPDPPWIVAHRGASAVQPENSLASVTAAVAQGAHMVEIDVQLTRDGELVLIHDFEIGSADRAPDRGRPLVVEEAGLPELEAALAEASPEAASSLATLPEVLAALPEGFPLNLEIKHRRAGVERLAERLLGALGERPRVLVSSFDRAQLSTLRRLRPDLPLAPIGRERPHELLRAAESLGAATVHCHRRLAFADFVSAARAGGWPVLVYTINEPALAASLFERGVAGVFTDRPGDLLAALDPA
jgi:glycerophosphoryl diester phosphodiesterase